MLQFWKKTNHKNLASNVNVIDVEVSNNETSKKDENLQFLQISEKIIQLGDVSICKNKSSIMKTLPEILQHKSVLNYFINFMESRNAKAYISCWLDIEAFKTDFPTYSIEDSEFDKYNINNNCDNDSGDISNSFETDISILDNSSQERKKYLNNALIIFKKYVAQEAVLNVGCTDEIRKDLIERICDCSQSVSKNCFDRVQNQLFKILEKDYFEDFLSSDFYLKYQIDIYTNGNIVLDDIINNETALFYFLEFLEQENQQYLMEFWIAATNFQQQLLQQGEFADTVESQKDAIVLYDKYFSLQAHCPLGLGDKVRLLLEDQICGENGMNWNCFNIPIAIVERILEEYFVAPFLESQLFYKYLSEMINTVQATGYGTFIKKHKRSSSETDSELSLASSTFLALEFNQNTLKNSKSKTNMVIDARELYDPDSLWKQKRRRNLICGHISDYGKFETEFEPEPDRGDFKLRNVVKKFVSLDEEQKKKEEMAWQVAEMIVRDITNITLNNND